MNVVQVSVTVTLMQAVSTHMAHIPVNATLVSLAMAQCVQVNLCHGYVIFSYFFKFQILCNSKT